MTKPTLLTAADGLPYHIITATRAVPLLLLCEHASNRVPEGLHNLGLNEHDIQRHFAVDIGAAAVTEALAAQLGCTAVLARFSRAVIDCNRQPTHPALMTPQEDGVTIPANQAITAADKQARLDEIFVPFHDALAQQLEQLEKNLQRKVAVIAMHSFTPQYRAMPLPRPWQIGVLWDHDAVTAGALLQFLHDNTHYEVGDNQPYSLKTPPNTPPYTYSMETHVIAAGRAGVVIEIRNDEIVTPRGVAHYAALLARFFAAYQPPLISNQSTS